MMSAMTHLDCSNMETTVVPQMVRGLCYLSGRLSVVHSHGVTSGGGSRRGLREVVVGLHGVSSNDLHSITV
ncbi:hypothetical protein B296_00025554 [Ensete ventricosum]|uniref:Uncharacterized protein n=1 Tax=Ensete ventricosum TaxID=4639 RepID=A0A426ZT80_ENSVE|nr:hypothetical protein B296_00025554 [Ensete ventricosum]